MNKDKSDKEQQPTEIPVRKDPDKRYPMKDPDQQKNPGDDKYKPTKLLFWQSDNIEL